MANVVVAHNPKPRRTSLVATQSQSDERMKWIEALHLPKRKPTAIGALQESFAFHLSLGHHCSREQLRTTAHKLLNREAPNNRSTFLALAKSTIIRARRGSHEIQSFALRERKQNQIWDVK